MAIVLPQLPEKYQFKPLKDVIQPKILNCVQLDEKYFKNAEIRQGYGDNIVVVLNDTKHRYKDNERTIEFSNGLFEITEFMQYIGIHGKTFHVSQKDELMKIIPEGFTKDYYEGSKIINLTIDLPEYIEWDDKNTTTAFLIKKHGSDPIMYEIELSEERVTLERNRVTNSSNDHPIPLDFSDYLEPV